MIPMGMQSVCEGFAESQAIDINESVRAPAVIYIKNGHCTT